MWTLYYSTYMTAPLLMSTWAPRTTCSDMLASALMTLASTMTWSRALVTSRHDSVCSNNGRSSSNVQKRLPIKAPLSVYVFSPCNNNNNSNLATQTVLASMAAIKMFALVARRLTRSAREA